MGYNKYTKIKGVSCMKKLVSIVLSMCFIFSFAVLFSGCGKKEDCVIILPEDLPDGVESITCDSTITKDEEEVPGTSYDGEVTITVTLKDGYNFKGLYLMIGTKEASEHKYYDDSKTSGKTRSYEFEDVKRNLEFSFKGKPTKENYFVSFNTPENVTDTPHQTSEVFIYELIKDGESSVSEEYTSTEFYDLVKEGIRGDFHYGDKIKVTHWNPSVLSVVNSGVVSLTNGSTSTAFEVEQDGIIKCYYEMTVTGTAEVMIDFTKLYSDRVCDHGVISADKEALIDTTIFKDDIQFMGGTSQLSDFSAADSYKLKASLTETDISTYVLSNYADSTLSFKINGVDIAKEDISIDGQEFIINNVKAPYEYMARDKVQPYNPAEYNVEILGVEEFLAKDSTKTKNISITKGSSLNDLTIVQVTPIYKGLYLAAGTLSIRIEQQPESEINDFNITIKFSDGEEIIFENCVSMEFGPKTEARVSLVKMGEDPGMWQINVYPDQQPVSIKIG